MTNEVTEAMLAVCKRARESAIREQSDNPGKWSCDIDRAIVSDILAHLSREPVDTGVDPQTGEDLSICEGCQRPVQRGQFVNVYEQGTVHVDCDNPDATTDPSVVDGEAGPTYIMAGHPMRYFRAADPSVTFDSEAVERRVKSALLKWADARDENDLPARMVRSWHFDIARDVARALLSLAKPALLEKQAEISNTPEQKGGSDGLRQRSGQLGLTFAEECRAMLSAQPDQSEFTLSRAALEVLVVDSERYGALNSAISAKLAEIEQLYDGAGGDPSSHGERLGLAGAYRALTTLFGEKPRMAQEEMLAALDDLAKPVGGERERKLEAIATFRAMFPHNAKVQSLPDEVITAMREE